MNNKEKSDWLRRESFRKMGLYDAAGTHQTNRAESRQGSHVRFGHFIKFVDLTVGCRALSLAT
jgi:hypothetical protein